ncbi:hypothetical protein MTO96_025461 [Rhipicephalus appendiculatus]
MQEQGPLPEDVAPDAGRLPEIRVQEADHAEVVLQVPNQQRLPRRFKRKLVVCLTFLVIVAVATLALHSIAERVEHTVHHAGSSNLTGAQLVASRGLRHANTTAVPHAIRWERGRDGQRSRARRDHGGTIRVASPCAARLSGQTSLWIFIRSLRLVLMTFTP